MSQRKVASFCDDNRVYMTVSNLISHYNKLAKEAKDETDKQMYLQHAEHYKKISNNGR